MVVRQRVMSNSRRNKVTRNQFGTLMDQLIKRMLTVSAGFASDNRASLVVHRVTVAIHILAV